MSNSPLRRPSSGVVIGLLALVLAIGGTAFAGSRSDLKLTKGKVKSIATKQVQTLAPELSVKRADTAGRAENVFAANVAADGSLVSSVPSGATSSKVALGDYRVNFGRSIAGCTLSASASRTDSGPSLAFVAVGVAGGGAPDTLQVFTRSETNVVADRAFSVQMVCPA